MKLSIIVSLYQTGRCERNISEWVRVPHLAKSVDRSEIRRWREQIQRACDIWSLHESGENQEKQEFNAVILLWSAQIGRWIEVPFWNFDDENLRINIEAEGFSI